MRLGDGLWTPGVLPPHFVNYLPNSPAQGEAAHCHLLGWRACPRGLPAVILHPLSSGPIHTRRVVSPPPPTPSLCTAQAQQDLCFQRRFKCWETSSFPGLLCWWGYVANVSSGWTVRATNEIGSRKVILQPRQVLVSQSWKRRDISTSWQAAGLVWSLMSYSFSWLPVSWRKYWPSCFSFLYFMSCSSLDRLLSIRTEGHWVSITNSTLVVFSFSGTFW